MRVFLCITLPCVLIHFASAGVVFPGENLKIVYLFKSPNPGIFTEAWRLRTRPVLCGGAPITIVLRGLALQTDPLLSERAKFEVLYLFVLHICIGHTQYLLLSIA